MSSQYAIDQAWNLHSQFSQGQQVQLEEEYYMPRQLQGQNHPQPPPLHLHTASYPPARGQYRPFIPNFSQNPTVQQPTRSQSYGNNATNGRTLGHNTEDVYGNSMSQAPGTPFHPTQPSVNGLYPNPQHPYRQSYTPRSSSPGTASGIAPPDHITGTNQSEGGISPPFTSSPMSLPLTFESQASQGQSQYQQQQAVQYQLSGSNNNNGGAAHEPEYQRQAKRSRGLEEEDDFVFGLDVGMDHDNIEGQDGKDPKSKPFGACARCKGLKVKCEFRSSEDPCKRCMNAGKECVIPGRKKRRTPPKREHLLAEIRDQAAQIKKLMAQLETTKGSPQSQSTSVSIRRLSPGADLHSPLDPSSPDSPNPVPKPDVEEWIAKARESIEAFGGFIGAGGAGMTKSFLVDEDPEDSESSEDDAYEFAVEDEDGEPVEIDEFGGENQSDAERKRRSTSRDMHSVTGSNGSGPQKKEPGGAQKLVILPTEASPFGLIAKMSLKHRRRRSSQGVEDEDDVGVANEDFFRSSPTPDPIRTRMLSDPKQTPHILIRGIITPDEAEKLFRIFFDNMGLSVSLLDPVLYTAQKTCYRSPFLFTVICAIASRYFTEKPELYADLMHYAQLAAGTALISGQKSVEVCQAYILLSLYPVPARRWEDDRSWLYLGMAIRVAAALNLHFPNTAKPLNEQHARELLNRTRVWLNCFNLDRSTGIQYGKPPTIPNADYVANHSQDWWNSSEYNMKNFDIQICCYNAELRVMGNFVKKIYSDPNHPTGLNKDADFELIATETDDELQNLGDRWFAILEQTDQTDPQNRFRTGLLRLAYSYARLVALSFGFQHAFGKNNTDENPFLTRCLAAASDVVNTFVNDVGRPAQRIYLRHGPEAQSVFATFAASFLVKLLQPKFATYLSREKRLEIRGLVQNVADLLGCSEIAIDDRHGPKLYSRFLKGLLATPMASVDTLSPNGMMNTIGLPNRRPARQHKSGSQGSFDLTTANKSNSASPFISNSPSHPPPPADASLNVFTSITGVDPSSMIQGQYATQSALFGQTDPAPVANINDWLPTPLPFDSELLQSMQSVQDSVWGQDLSMPGFHWMNNIQTGSDDIYMKSGDSGNNSSMFYYDLKTPSP